MDIEKSINLTIEEKKAIQYIEHPQVKLTPYLLSIINKENPNCPVRKQFIPTLNELKIMPSEMQNNYNDKSTIPHLSSVSSKICVLYITEKCPAHCRFCRRKRKVQEEVDINENKFKECIEYIQKNDEINEVIISGGEPFSLSDDMLEFILFHLRNIKNVELLRIETRMLLFDPKRFTKRLYRILANSAPIYISYHINHPKELTPEVREIFLKLVEHKIFIMTTTVLLKSVNDKTLILSHLFYELTKLGIRPHYLYQCDFSPGTEHFRVPIHSALRLLHSLWITLPMTSIPTFIVNLPDNGGSIPVYPEYIVSQTKDRIIFKGIKGEVYIYQDKLVSQDILTTALGRR